MTGFFAGALLEALKHLSHLSNSDQYLDILLVSGYLIVAVLTMATWLFGIYPSSTIIIDQIQGKIIIPVPRKFSLLGRGTWLRFRKYYILPVKLNVNVDCISKIHIVSNPSGSLVRGRQYPAITFNTQENNYRNQEQTIILFTLINGSFSSVLSRNYALKITEKLTAAVTNSSDYIGESS